MLSSHKSRLWSIPGSIRLRQPRFIGAEATTRHVRPCSDLSELRRDNHKVLDFMIKTPTRFRSRRGLSVFRERQSPP